MGEVVGFRYEKGAVRQSSLPTGEGKILWFTGVRYVRDSEPSEDRKSVVRRVSKTPALRRRRTKQHG